MSSGPNAASPAATPGPTISFGFNLGKIPDQGEDSDPILRDGPDLGLVGVFDGMGGAGGTVYETPDGPRTGAYLASRIARDVVERRMLDLLQPDWNLPGRATAEDLRRSVKEALVAYLAQLNAPRSGLRSKLLRALPTTMSLVALQRTQRDGAVWSCHVFWSGDSRSYVFEPEGARQLTTDDIRDAGDAMTNLRQDSVVSNAMSADTDFVVNYRKVQLRAPFLIVSATDGCFGYVPSPMHFEHMVLKHLVEQRTTAAWSAALQREISAVTGDDAAMSTLAVGADLEQFRALFAPRVTELQQRFTEPLDQARQAVARAERELEAVRRQQTTVTADLWGAYKPEYERYLHVEAGDDDDGVETRAEPDRGTSTDTELPHGESEAAATEAGTAERESSP